MDLASKKCVPCKVGTPPLTQAEIEPLLNNLKLDWEVIDGKALKHEFKFKDFLESMEFVNKIAKIAEEEGHHPDIYIYYNKVIINLKTHNIRGLSENDFIVAAKVEKLVI